MSRHGRTTMNIKTKLLGIEEVIEYTSLKRTTIYNLVKDGDFPGQLDIATRRALWSKDEIDNWIERKIKERDMAKAENIKSSGK